MNNLKNICIFAAQNRWYGETASVATLSTRSNVHSNNSKAATVSFGRCVIFLSCTLVFFKYFERIGGYAPLSTMLPILLLFPSPFPSSHSALAVYTDDNDLLLFHDVVRPLVSERIITDCVKALQRYDAMTVASPLPTPSVVSTITR